MCATCRRHIDDAPWRCFAMPLHLCLCCVSHVGGGSLYEPEGCCRMYSKHCIPLIGRHFVYDSVPCVPCASKGASFASRLSMHCGTYGPAQHSHWLMRQRHGFASLAVAMQADKAVLSPEESCHDEKCAALCSVGPVCISTSDS